MIGGDVMDDPMADDVVRERLTVWLRAQLPDAEDVRIEGLDRIDFGVSAEMMVLTLVSQIDGVGHRREVVLRLARRIPGSSSPTISSGSSTSSVRSNTRRYGCRARCGWQIRMRCSAGRSS
jgi:hypothetical protein